MMKTLVVSTLIAGAAFGVGVGYGSTGTAPVATVASPVASAPTVAAVAPVTACTPQAASDAPQAPAPAAPAASQAGLVNLNTATDAELDKLPEIGRARIAWITAARPIKAIDDLAGPHMPASVIAMLKQRATV